MSQGGRIASIVAASDDRLAFAVSFVGGVLPAHASLRYEETHNLRQMGFLPGVAHVLARPSAWALVHVSQSDFWDAVGDFDPLAYWSRADLPILFQFGDADTNVDTAGSVARLRTLERPDVRIEVYAGSGHALQQPPDQGDAVIRPEALRDLVDFIDDQIAIR
jgi:pimeloyl-ACP methyl ester carboxylesterase